MLVDHPPSVRYAEICVPLPKSTHLWTAGSEDDRRRLQWQEPAGREKARFCFLMRDALDIHHRRHPPCRLTEADYHLGLCSFQVGTWEAAHKAHGCESDELVTDVLPREHVQDWRTQLDLWLARMETDCQLRRNYFHAAAFTSGDDHNVFAPLSLLLWHLLNLTLFAPLKFIQGQSYTDGGFVHKHKARLREWVTSVCARTAVWNAAQICRVVARETSTPTRLALNPLAIPGVLKSAIITCSYANETRACPACTTGASGSPAPPIDLFHTEREDARLAQWKEHGGALATWGPAAVPLCICHILELAGWFRAALGRDRDGGG